MSLQLQTAEPVGGYLHGTNQQERDRLHRQAHFLTPYIHVRLPFNGCKRLLEVGSGVGAQTAILLRNHPQMHITCIEKESAQIEEARRFLATVPEASGRYELVEADATRLAFADHQFDSAFCCWVLEHVPNPERLLSEVRRVLAPGAPIACQEVLNHTLFLDPPCAETMAYWKAFNDCQRAIGGDPYVGGRLGNLLHAAGFHSIEIDPRPTYFDARTPEKLSAFMEYFSDLLLSAASSVKASPETISKVRQELAQVAATPNGAFFYCAIHAQAKA